LVDIVQFFKFHADVHYILENRPMGRFGDADGLFKSLDRMLLNLVQRLPEEEQFMPWTNAETQNKVVAEFLIGPKLHVTTVWEHLCRGDPTYFMDLKADGNPPPPDTVANMLSIASSPKVSEWQQNLQARELGNMLYTNCFYDLDSPFFVVNILTDNIEKISDDQIIMSIVHNIAEVSYRWRERKVMNGLLDSLGSQGYEDNMIGEARRLGFGKEMDELERKTKESGTFSESDPLSK